MSKAKESEKKGAVPKLRFPEFRDAGPWAFLRGDRVFEQVSNKDHNSDLPILAITQEHGAIPRDNIDYHVSVTEQSIESYKVVEPEDFIISLRSFQGGIEYSSFRGLCSPAYVILRRKSKGNNQFFKHFFKTKAFIRSMTKNIEGIRDGKMVSYKQFSDLLLPSPADSEQQKIADCLSSLDALIAAQADKLDALKAQKKGLMQRLFPREGETVPELRFPEFRDAGEWNTGNISDIAEVASGGTPSRAKTEYWDGDLPWVSTTLIDFNTIEKANEFITQVGLASSAAKVFPKGTILMAMYGQGKTRGKVAVLGIDAAINQACAAISCNKTALPEFVYQNLAGRYNEIRRVSNSGGQENLSAVLIKSLPISYPDRLSGEQQKIADCFSSIDALITAQAEKLDALKVHKKGLMQQLFPSPEAVET